MAGRQKRGSMNKKFRNRVFAFVLALALITINFGTMKTSDAKADTSVIKTWGGATTIFSATPGETLHITIPVSLSSMTYTMATGNLTASVEPATGAPFNTAICSFSRGTVKPANLALTYYDYVNVSADLVIDDTAKIGQYTANINFGFTCYDADSGNTITSATLPITISIATEKQPAQISISGVTYDASRATVGNTFTLTYTVRNDGEIKAYNLYDAIAYGDTGMTPNYTSESMKIGDLKSGDEYTQNIPIKILPTAAEGYKTLSITFTYKDSKGTEYTTTKNVYITISKNSSTASDDAKLTVSTDSLNDEVSVKANYNLNLTINNVGKKTATDIVVSIPDDGGIGASTGILANYENSGVTVKDMKMGASKNVTVPLSITSAAAAGLKELTVQVTYKDSKGNSLTSVVKAYITVLAAAADDTSNEVEISNIKQSPSAPKAGEPLSITFTVKNNGSGRVSNIIIFGEELASTGFEPSSSNNTKTSVGSLKKGESKQVTMKFKVGESIADGMNTLKLAVTYKDEKGNSQKEETQAYILNCQKAPAETAAANVITIADASQSVSEPNAGEDVTISFSVTNKGTKDVTDFQISGDGLGSTNFEPTTSNAYTSLGTIKAGESKFVSMNFKVGADITEGFNQLKLAYTYVDSNGAAQTGSGAVNVINVKNTGSANSKPRLIISAYSADSNELVAGSTFNFSFTLKNTHATKTAKNIKVTVSQKDSIFSTTSGSDTMYIESIAPGQEVTNVLNMKVKNDAATGTYEITIAVEYEYDDMNKTDTDAGGVKDENTVKLSAIENARPVVQNINIGAGMDSPVVNTSIAMAFDFYNMGKSTLNNVYATVSGDFELDSSTMFYIGSVSAGSSVTDNEPSVIPLVSGDAKGVLTIHYEDSNGNEKTVDFDIPATTVGEDTAIDGGGDIVIPDDSGNTADTAVTKAILPTWLFIVIEIAGFIVITLVTRSVIISRKKKQLIKAEEEENK